MEENRHGKGKMSPELLLEYQESQREIRLIGEQLDKIFLCEDLSPPLPEWLTSEKEIPRDPTDVTEENEGSESDLDQDSSVRERPRRRVPAASPSTGSSNEPDRDRTELGKLAKRIDELRRRIEGL